MKLVHDNSRNFHVISLFVYYYLRVIQGVSRDFKRFLGEIYVFDGILGPHQVHQGFHGISPVGNQCFKGFRLFKVIERFSRDFRVFNGIQGISSNFMGV